MTSSAQPAERPRVVSEHDAARYVGLSVSYLRKCRAGRASGPAFLRIGRTIRYTLLDLDEFINARRVRGNQ